MSQLLVFAISGSTQMPNLRPRFPASSARKPSPRGSFSVLTHQSPSPAVALFTSSRAYLPFPNQPSSRTNISPPISFTPSIMSRSVCSVKLKYDPSQLLRRTACRSYPCGIRWRCAQRWYWRETSPLPFSDHTRTALGVVNVTLGSSVYGPLVMSMPAKTSMRLPSQLRRTRLHDVPVHSSATPSTFPRSSSTSFPNETIIAGFDSHASRVPAQDRYCTYCPRRTSVSATFASLLPWPVKVSTRTTSDLTFTCVAKLSARRSLTGPPSAWRTSTHVSTAPQSSHDFT